MTLAIAISGAACATCAQRSELGVKVVVRLVNAADVNAEPVGAVANAVCGRRAG
ncbi:hypothetical protein I552_3998 [Mycobacterium xenopi 3993]|nr:hypothetical protein I552_3998 [Mycobacterium xenopi 3993]